MEGHKPTVADGPKKLALRNTEDGYFVPAMVANMPLTVLVDTGSNATTVRKDLLDIWPREHLPHLTPVNTQLITATGECSPFYGKAKINITLGRQNLQHEILFADIKNDGVLGINFLSANHCDMLLSRDHLVLNGKRLACFRSTENAPPACCRIALLGNVEIPPECEIIVKGRPVDRFDKDGIGMFRQLCLSLWTASGKGCCLSKKRVQFQFA